MDFCCPRRVFAHAQYKIEFDDAERLSGRLDDNRTQKVHVSYCVNILKIRSKNKVALAVELSIYIHYAVWKLMSLYMSENSRGCILHTCLWSAE